MILLWAVLAGILVGLGLEGIKGRVWHPPIFRSLWLVFLGFFPQWIAFYLPLTRRLIPDQLASICLVASQTLLMFFAFANRRLPGMLVLIVGLLCNLAVIAANNGFMPLPIEAAANLVSRNDLNSIPIGERISSASKDVLLPESQILLPWLADRFVSPGFISYRFAFSLGDVFISAGAFWTLLKGSVSSADVNSGDP